MRRARWATVLVLGTLLIGGVGTLTASAENYCDPIDDTFCVLTDVTTEDTCCVDVGGGVRRIATCSREQYYCLDGPTTGLVWGGAFNCHTFGQECQ